MHRIAQICTYIFENFPAVTPQTPKTGEGASQSPPLSACPPFQFFRASAAAGFSELIFRQLLFLPSTPIAACRCLVL